MNLGLYAKSIVSIVAAGLGILVVATQDNVFTPTEYVQLGIAIVTAIGVYGVPNFPETAAKYLKTGVALLGAGLQALVVILDGVNDWSAVTTSGWIGVLIAALAAVGVYVLPNTVATAVVPVSPEALDDLAENGLTTATPAAGNTFNFNTPITNSAPSEDRVG